MNNSYFKYQVSLNQCLFHRKISLCKICGFFFQMAEKEKSEVDEYEFSNARNNDLIDDFFNFILPNEELAQPKEYVHKHKPKKEVKNFPRSFVGTSYSLKYQQDLQLDMARVSI